MKLHAELYALKDINDSLSTLNDNDTTLYDETVSIGTTLSNIDTTLNSIKTRAVWDLYNSGNSIDENTVNDGNRWYYHRNTTGESIQVKSLNFSFVTTGVTFSHNCLMDCSDTNNQFRTGTGSTASTQDMFHSELPSNIQLWPYLVDARALNATQNIYSFKIPLNFEVVDDDYIIHKIHNTFSDSGVVAMMFQAEVEY